jgi:hypothetical protein
VSLAGLKGILTTAREIALSNGFVRPSLPFLKNLQGILVATLEVHTLESADNVLNFGSRVRIPLKAATDSGAKAAT